MQKTPQSVDERQTSYLKILTICAVLLTFIAVTVTLFQLRAVFVPFTLSIFLYFMLVPAVDFLESDWHFPRPLSIALAIFAALVLISLLGLILTTSFANLLENSSLYLSKLQLTLDGLSERLSGAGIHIEISRIQSELQKLNFLSIAQQFTSGFLGMLGSFVLVMIFTSFFLLGNAGAKRQSFVKPLAERVSKYVSIKFAVSLLTGIAVGVSLKIIGVEFAITFGLLTFILNFIPNIGSIIATMLPLPIVFLESGFGWPFLLTLAIPGSIQMYVGNVLEPKLMGESLGLHPVVVLFFLFFWGIVWGLPGMFLSVPIMATIKFILTQSPATQFAVDLLEGRLNRFFSHLPL